MKGFYKLEYIPNKIVYVFNTDNKNISFLAFFSEGKGLKAIKHTISKKLIKDFKKPINCFNPSNEVKELIKDYLKKELKNI